MAPIEKPKSWEFYIVIVSIIISNSYVHARERERCGISNDSPGYTRPTGDIYVKYGDPLQITCSLHPSVASKFGPNSSQYLGFERNGERLSRDMITVLNNTSIELYVERPVKSDSTYACVFKNSTVCNNYVNVGVPPQPVEDFQCISYNLDNLTCTWTTPNNYISTTYYLYFEFVDSPQVNNSCKHVINGQSIVNCTWTLKSKPIFRQSHEYYFYLNITNRFGNYSMDQYHFKHDEHVKPNPPVNLIILEKTWNSMYLQWKVPTTLTSFFPGIKHRVLYQCEYGKKQWYKGGLFTQPLHNSTLKQPNNVKFNLTGLEYPYALYDIRVALSIPTSGNKKKENMWSDFSFLTNRTASKEPGYPPRTNVGSFEILTYTKSNEYMNVCIYWSHIIEERRNGANFTYIVTLEGDNSFRLESEKNAYMLISNLSSAQTYKFNIWAQNEVGRSFEKSLVTVPSHKDYVPEPTHLTVEEFGNRFYQLTWKPPKLVNIKNYTIFWCNDVRDRPPCNGHLDWATVPGHATSHNQTIPRDGTFQFAISANTENSSSGMAWAHCNDIYNKYSVGKITDVSWIDIGSTFLHAQWRFGCSDRSVTGYILYYCPIIGVGQSCKEPEKNITVGKTETDVKIEGLRPYTTYNLRVAAIINETMFSQSSSPIRHTTMEGAPSTPPINPRITEVTTSSFALQWEPPTSTNGNLRDYIIHFNNESWKVNSSTYQANITGLRSYENFLITMQACTTDCSKMSKILNVTTLIDYPSPINKPVITHEDDTVIIIGWEKPAEPRGRNDFYEVRISQYQYENHTLQIEQTKMRNWSIQSCGNDKRYNTYYVSVRAVNIVGVTRLAGNWSAELQTFCRSPSNYIIYILVPVIIIFLVGMTYLSKKMYMHCQIMRNVEVKLPPGLAPVTTDMTMVPWTSEKHLEDSDRHAAADEELLLMKKNENRHKNGGDSSGCSSAHESVTSTLESASNISSSTSDSGTEQHRLTNADELRKNSLRQRNISANRPPVNKSYVVLPSDGGQPNTWNTKNYCILGIDPGSSVESNSTYIPISVTSPSDNPYLSCEATNQSPPYVLTGEVLKTINPGYIPYNSNISETKSPSYVVAGNKDMIVSDLLNMDQNIPVSSQDSKMYVKVADNVNLKIADPSNWQSPVLDPVTNKTGYVSIGDIPPPTLGKEHKGYVPHRQFETKALKED